jgi:hypothetical protein
LVNLKFWLAKHLNKKSGDPRIPCLAYRREKLSKCDISVHCPYQIP